MSGKVSGKFFGELLEIFSRWKKILMKNLGGAGW
jgi:hypothetical protein